MQQLDIFTEPPAKRAIRLRDQAMQSVGQKAEDVKPGFGQRAADFILRYLRAHGRKPGEVLTEACKAAGIVAHDDRAFGPVYYSLAKRNLIRKVGTVKRLKGHGTAGGNVWEAV